MEGKPEDTFDPAGMFDLSGKLALVTGATSGIGQAMARALAGAGADIIGVSLEDDASETQGLIEATGRSFTAIQADFSNREVVDQVARSVTEGPRPIDILVNNAGMISRAPAVEHSVETWDKVIDVNLRAPYVFAKTIGATMVQRGRGKIIFTASLLSFQGGILVPSYTASKSAVAGLVKALANEWAPHRVNVNAVAPGYIATANTQALRADPDRSRAILDRIPAGRWGLASDLGGAAVFLASPASDYIFGTIIPVDGGWLAR